MGGGGTEETSGPEVPPNPTQSPQKPNGWTAGSARGQQLAQGAELGQRQPSRPAVLFMLVLLPGFSSSAGRWETDGKCFFYYYYYYFFTLFPSLFERPAVQCVHGSAG